MHEIRERVAYLQGLAEGLHLDDTTKEGRVILSIIDVLDEMALQMADVVDAQNELAEYVEDVDDDLTSLEEMHVADEEEEEHLSLLDDGDEICCEVIACPECGEPVQLVGHEDAISDETHA